MVIEDKITQISTKYLWSTWNHCILIASYKNHRIFTVTDTYHHSLSACPFLKRIFLRMIVIYHLFLGIPDGNVIKELSVVNLI